MLPVSQILERNIAIFNSSHWLVINPEESSWINLCQAAQLTVLHQFFDVFQECTGFRSPLSFDSRDVVANPNKLCLEISNGRHKHIYAAAIEKQKFDKILICIPKSKAHLRFLLDMASANLSQDGSIYLVGENRGGIKSVAKMLKGSGNITKEDSARHCTLLQYHPFTCGQAFQLSDYINLNTYTLADHQWLCCNFPGVFSSGKLDEGTALLLAALPLPISGTTLDFACGGGVIAAYAMTKLPHVAFDLLDVSAVALFAAAHTLAANNLYGKLIASNGLLNIADSYQNIVSNPPFHTGVHTDYEITTRFIDNARDVLAKDGKMFIVANKFLPYLPQLKQHFHQVDVVKQNARFTVYLSS